MMSCIDFEPLSVTPLLDRIRAGVPHFGILWQEGPVTDQPWDHPVDASHRVQTAIRGFIP